MKETEKSEVANGRGKEHEKYYRRESYKKERKVGVGRRGKNIKKQET